MFTGCAVRYPEDSFASWHQDGSGQVFSDDKKNGRVKSMFVAAELARGNV